MNNKLTYLVASLCVCSISTASYADSPYFSFQNGDGFKRFSVSAGWLHAMPQGKANPFQINTQAKNGSYKVGEVHANTVTGIIADTPDDQEKKKKLQQAVSLGGLLGIVKDGLLTSEMSGEVNINSLESWTSEGTGLEANNVDTLGLLFNYHFTDNWSLEIKAGLPPEVDIKGKGTIYAPLNGIALPIGNLDPAANPSNIVANIAINSIGEITLESSIPITSLEQSKYASSARAWLPAAEIHYQFGRTGVDRFRPYVGLGLIYAYFDKVKINEGIESDLIKSGHMIQNILDNKAGASLENKESTANPTVKVKASSTFAPIATLGATFDFDKNWFAVGSVSYSKMNNEAKIEVIDSNTGKNLIRSSTKIDIDPLITYVGIGYRF